VAVILTILHIVVTLFIGLDPGLFLFRIKFQRTVAVCPLP